MIVPNTKLFPGVRQLLGIAIAASLGLAGLSPAMAGSASPQQQVPGGGADLSGASVEEIRTHILDTCVIQQWGTSTSPSKGYAEQCGCYARNVTRALGEEELAAFRRSGVFNDSARTKAQAAQAACKLR